MPALTLQGAAHQTVKIGFGLNDIRVKHLVQVDTNQSQTLSHIYLSTSTDFDNVKCFSLMCVNPKSMFQSNVLPPISVNPEKIQNAGPSPSVFSGKKIQSTAMHHLYMLLSLEFFPEIAPGDSAKNGIYVCSARHIPSHIGICHLKLAS